jgi:hypothetical protein
MTAQASLFGNDGGGVAEIKPAAPKPARCNHQSHVSEKLLKGMVRKPAVPHGTPDKRGRYWYERFHEDVQELPENVRETLLEIILYWPYDRMDTARKMLDRYCKADVSEQDNFCEAMGR